ncbi:hypothetical protein ABK040_011908 [Willaertia magna]
MNSASKNCVDDLDISNFEIKILTEEYVEQVAMALAVVFALEEPLAIGTKTSVEAYYPYALGYIERCAKAKLSHIAVEKSTNKAVGFHLCFDSDGWVEPPSDDEGILLHLRFLDDLHAKYEEEQQKLHFGKSSTTTSHNVKKIYKICSAGTYKEYRRLGLAKQMFQEAVKLAKEKGYEQIMVECTGYASQRLYEKLGFRELTRLYYENYEIVDTVNQNGTSVERKRKPFVTIPKDIADSTNLMVMDI